MKNFGQYVKVMAKINGRDVLPDVKMPRRERKDKGERRGDYNNPEAQFRIEAMKYLRHKGCRVWRIENSLPGYKGLPDIILFRHDKFWCVELKSSVGKLRPEQEDFQDLCSKSRINYLVARTIEDLYVITGEVKYDSIDGRQRDYKDALQDI